MLSKRPGTVLILAGLLLAGTLVSPVWACGDGNRQPHRARARSQSGIAQAQYAPVYGATASSALPDGTTSGLGGLPTPSYHWDPSAGVAPDGSPIQGHMPPRHNSLSGNGAGSGGGATIQRQGTSLIINNPAPARLGGGHIDTPQDAMDRIRTQVNSQLSDDTVQPMPYRGHRARPNYMAMRPRGRNGSHRGGRHNNEPQMSNIAYEENLFRQGQASTNRRRNFGLQSSARELESELNEQPNYQKGIRLVSQGTNLYVRNYETFHSAQYDRDNAIPLVARPHTLQEVFKQPIPASLEPVNADDALFARQMRPEPILKEVKSNLPEPLNIAPNGSE